MHKKKIIRLIGVAGFVILGPLMLVVFSPAELPIYLLVVPFVWVFGVLFLAIKGILVHRTELGGRQVLLISLLVSSLPTLLIVLQSIQQLSVRDIVLLIGFTALGLVYLLRADFIR